MKSVRCSRGTTHAHFGHQRVLQLGESIRLGLLRLLQPCDQLCLLPLHRDQVWHAKSENRAAKPT